VDAGADGTALVHGRLLADLVAALPPLPVEVAVTGQELELGCGSARFTLPTLPVADHPRLPPLPPPVGTLPAATFAAAVAQVGRAASRDDAVAVLTAVRIGFEGDALTLLATDRYRLAVRRVPWRPATPPVEGTALVPARTLAEAARAHAAAGGDVTLGLSGSLIGFSRPGRGLAVRVFDEVEYPPMDRLLDRVHTATAQVVNGDLVDVVRRVALVAERATPVSLAFTADRVVVRAAGAHAARGQEELPARYDGEPLTVALNPQYLLDGLTALGGPVAVFSFVDATRPPQLGAATTDGEPLDDVRYLLQPVRLRGRA
jgi:DNA polymerase-3 subunit beta